MKKIKTLKYGELFCGAGGLSLGAVKSFIETEDKLINIKHEWANDYNYDACMTYINNICPQGKESVIIKDVKEININTLSPIDIFAYGFPCNDFSNVGEMKGFKGEFGALYTYGIKVINKFKPLFFIAENVSGLRSTNNGLAFSKILNDLEKSGNGYNLTTHLYKAEEYGIPQRRHRIIIVGFKKELNLIFKVPAPNTKYSPISVREAIEVPPIKSDAPNHEFKKMSNVVIERLKYIKPGENVWNANIPNHLKLNVKNAKLSQIYRRLDPNKPSYTITGSGGGGTHGYHWSENRALTNRERARIQTFPDDFIFYGSIESVRKQIGMAVPPKLSSVIYISALKTLAGIYYDFIDSSLEVNKSPEQKIKKKELTLFNNNLE